MAVRQGKTVAYERLLRDSFCVLRRHFDINQGLRDGGLKTRAPFHLNFHEIKPENLFASGRVRIIAVKTASLPPKKLETSVFLRHVLTAIAHVPFELPSI
jgi:hypothetical protein